MRLSSASTGPKEIGILLISIAPEGPSRVGSSGETMGGLLYTVAGDTYEFEVGIFIAQTVTCSITCFCDVEQPVEDGSSNDSATPSRDL
jgi:hypothetical protein